MGTKIHPTAIVASSAQIGAEVEIGPYSVIGPHVKIGNRTRLLSHVTVDGRTTIGERCHIFSGACLGTPAQVREYESIQSYLEIGDDNVIREYTTMNTSMKDGQKTVVGDRNFLMINAHIAHDCRLGNDITIANSAGLSGHVTIEDHAMIGGFVGIHQFVRIGKFSMIGGVSRVVQDVLPFATFSGHPAHFRGLNSVGLKRAGYAPKDAMLIKKALRMLCLSGLPLEEAIREVRTFGSGNSDIEHLVSFAEKSKRGFARSSSDLEMEEV